MGQMRPPFDHGAKTRRAVLAAIVIIIATLGPAWAQPQPPSNLQQSVLGARVTLSWTAAPGGVLSYWIEAGSGPGRADLAGISVSGTAVTFTGVPTGSYYVRVRSVWSGALSAPSNEVVVVVAPPGPPMNLTASVSDTSVSLTWTPPAGDGAEWYLVEAGSRSGAGDLARIVTTQLFFSTAGVAPGTYYVRVRAVNTAGIGAASNEVLVSVAAPAVPGAPAAFSVTVTAGGMVRLQWQPPVTGGAVNSYRLEAGTAPGLADVAQLPVGNVLSFATVAPERLYYVRVRAVNAAGLGPASSEGVANVTGLRNGIPTSGTPVPALAAFDQAITSLMASRGIGAAALAITRGTPGPVTSALLERGYGWSDSSRTIPLLPNTPFRLASVVKPMTASVVYRLAAAGRLSLADRAFCTGSNQPCHLTPPVGTIADARVGSITVGHLLAHQGGWDRDISGDPMFNLWQVATELRVTSPVSKGDIVRWLAARTLDFTPGTRTAYSNVGYLVLGQIVERVVGRPFETELQQGTFAPLGVASGELYTGRSRPTDRNPREPVYEDPFTTTSLFPPYGVVPWPDGGLLIEAFEAHGGVVATARSVARFLSGYWISGQPRTTVFGQDWTFYGSMPGTLTMVRQLPNGVNVAVLLNTRRDRNRIEISGDELRALVDAVVSQIDWSAFDAS